MQNSAKGEANAISKAFAKAAAWIDNRGTWANILMMAGVSMIGTALLKRSAGVASGIVMSHPAGMKHARVGQSITPQKVKGMHACHQPATGACLPQPSLCASFNKLSFNKLCTQAGWTASGAMNSAACAATALRQSAAASSARSPMRCVFCRQAEHAPSVPPQLSP